MVGLTRLYMAMPKVLGKFGSVLAEFEWPVSRLGPWDGHFGAVALSNATDVIAHQ
jgi:hypothetical protein